MQYNECAKRKKEVMHMKLGKKIKALRIRTGLTQEQLAQKLTVSPQTVSKWENGVAMPDITLLPVLAEVFGVSIDDLFDLSVQQRMNRIESRLEIGEELPGDIFREYEAFLKDQIEADQKRASELLATLYYHEMEAFSRKADRYAKEAVRLAPNEKNCEWMLQKTSGHAIWDWSVSNHAAAADFYRDLIQENPSAPLPYYYLLDNLIADRRADEAEQVLSRLTTLKDARPVMLRVYRAHIALSRFDEETADGIMVELTAAYPNDCTALYEAAQYYAAKSDYQKALPLYERSFEAEPRRPRFTDELEAIARIYEISGDYQSAADTCGRIITLLEEEWHMTEEAGLQKARSEKARLLSMI